MSGTADREIRATASATAESNGTTTMLESAAWSASSNFTNALAGNRPFSERYINSTSEMADKNTLSPACTDLSILFNAAAES